MNVLSLGAGVQSSALLLMSCRGDLPRLDAAVFADTGWEPPHVYRQVEYLTTEASRHGIPVHRVSAGSLREHTLSARVRGKAADGQRYASLPLVTESGGRLRRQCTREYKVEPIERFIRRDLLGLSKGQRAPLGAVSLWFGITADELHRVRMSGVGWKEHVYPFLGLGNGPRLPYPMRRGGVICWLAAKYPGERFLRSSCIGCPFHSDQEWRQIKADPDTWADAIAVDAAIRVSDAVDSELYLHRSARPLIDVDLSTPEEKGQTTLALDVECMGYCHT